MDPQQIITILLPLIAALASYIIQRGHYSSTVNTVIAGCSVLLAALASLFLQGQLTGHVQSDAVLVFTTAMALQAESFAPLQKYLRVNFNLPGVGTPPTPTITTIPSVKPTVADWSASTGGTTQPQRSVTPPPTQNGGSSG